MHTNFKSIIYYVQVDPIESAWTTTGVTWRGQDGANDKSLALPISLSIVSFFESREQVVVRRGHIQRTGWLIKILEAHVGPFLLGCKCPVSCFLSGQAKDFSEPLYFFQLRNFFWLLSRKGTNKKKSGRKWGEKGCKYIKDWMKPIFPLFQNWLLTPMVDPPSPQMLLAKLCHVNETQPVSSIVVC
jgi:hypothetical protein